MPMVLGGQSIITQMMVSRENGNYQDLVGRTGKESVSSETGLDGLSIDISPPEGLGSK